MLKIKLKIAVAFCVTEEVVVEELFVVVLGAEVGFVDVAFVTIDTEGK